MGKLICTTIAGLAVFAMSTQIQAVDNDIRVFMGSKQAKECPSGQTPVHVGKSGKCTCVDRNGNPKSSCKESGKPVIRGSGVQPDLRTAPR